MEYTQSEWYGFRRIDFLFDGREAVIVFPHKARADMACMVKTEYFGAFPSAEVEMLSRGYHLAYLKNENRWGCDNDQHIKSKFFLFLISEYNMKDRFILVGMSCGGLHAVNFTALYPNMVSALYLDAPVLNLLSCPCNLGIAQNPSSMRDELTDAWGFTHSDILFFRKHPIDKLSVLSDHSIPVVLIYGESDFSVPYTENGIVLEDYYKQEGLRILSIGKPGCGHHPHGLDDPGIIADFLDKYAL